MSARGRRISSRPGSAPAQPIIEGPFRSTIRVRRFEREVATGGPQAIGSYGEILAERYLRAHGVFPTPQYPYRDQSNLPHLVDFYDRRRRIACEVKTGRFHARSLRHFRVEHLRHALASGQLAKVVFLNVPFMGREGFSGAILRHIEGFEVITLDQSFINGTGYRMPLAEPRELVSLSGLLKLAEKHEPGPNPGFGREHTILAFLTIGGAGTIGRESLARQSGVGQGSVRTILKKFRQEGYMRTDPFGCHLTDSGKALYQSILKKVPPLVPIDGSPLSVGKSQVGILVRANGTRITNGISQRDSAIRVGATGATSYVIKGNKFTILGGSSDCEKDFPSKAWPILRSKLHPRNGDAVIISGAPDETAAKLGAVAAAITLL